MSKNVVLGGRKASKITCTKEEIEGLFWDCVPYLQYVIQSSGSINRVSRRYKTISETFAELGGIQSVLYFLVLLIHASYNNRVANRHIAKLLMEEVEAFNQANAETIDGENSPAKIP